MQPLTRLALSLALAGLSLAPAASASGQALGPFRWQFSPFCNVLTLDVLPAGASFTLSGFDDLCGAGRAPATGTATRRPDGALVLGLLLVTPEGLPVPVAGTLDPATLSGSWTDAAGHAGPLVFNPPGAAPGTPPRPAPAGPTPAPDAVTGLSPAPGTVTADRRPAGGARAPHIADGPGGAADAGPAPGRVTRACGPGEFLLGTAADGALICADAVTAVQAGEGLTGGGTGGAVTLGVAFAGSGSAPTAARSDHTHPTPPGLTDMLLYHASFQGTATNTANGGTVLSADGQVSLSTASLVGSSAIVRDSGISLMSIDLSKVGAFLSAAFRLFLLSGSPDPSQVSDVVVGDPSLPNKSSIGFRIRGDSLRGVTTNNAGAGAEVHLATILPGQVYRVLAIRRTGGVDFYVNGVLMGTNASIVLPDLATFRLYRASLTNGVTTGQLELQVSFLTIGVPTN